MLDTPSDQPSADDARSAASSALREALRRARAEAAQQTDVVIDLRQAEIARLELLKEALDPVFAAVPEEIDFFDVGIATGERPRLFVDMVAFVEMARDRRTYRFMRDSRRGRSCAAESEQIAPIVEAVTFYVAHRLVERERLLVDDDGRGVADALPQPDVAGGMASAALPSPDPLRQDAPIPERTSEPATEAAAEPAGGTLIRIFAILVALVCGGLLGAVAVSAVIFAASKGMWPY